jgi:hypothetical protein
VASRCLTLGAARPRTGPEIPPGAGVGAARVRFADVSRDKFEEAHAGLAGGDQRRDNGALGNELV